MTKRMTKKMKMEMMPLLMKRLTEIPYENVVVAQVMLESDLKQVQRIYINHLGMRVETNPLSKEMMCYG